MLTFEFTGVAGEMTVKERLTSGMVGREIQISLSEEWNDLKKTAVFIAGCVCRCAEMTGSIVTIPDDVLRHPFQKLRVGVRGENADSTLVIPTIMAEGPFIEVGADPTEDPVAVDLPVWQNLQNQIGDLTQLRTAAKDSLVSAINEVRLSLPVRGVDYWTDEDIAEIRSYVDEAIQGGQW